MKPCRTRFGIGQIVRIRKVRDAQFVDVVDRVGRLVSVTFDENGVTYDVMVTRAGASGTYRVVATSIAPVPRGVKPSPGRPPAVSTATGNGLDD